MPLPARDAPLSCDSELRSLPIKSARSLVLSLRLAPSHLVRPLRVLADIAYGMSWVR
jgi:hypothetical protein